MIRTLLVLGLGFGLGLGLSADAVGASDDGHLYVGAKKCKSCHKKELMGNQFAEWEKGPHSQAFETLKSDRAMEIAKENGVTGPPSKADDCLKCHSTAYGLTPEQYAKKPLKISDGIQCESCHGPGKDYRKKKVMSDRDKSIAKGMWEPGKEEEICAACHNEDTLGGSDETLYELADGTKVGWDYEQAKETIAHPIPEDVKGKYIEIEKKLKAEKKASGGAVEEEEDEE